MCSINFIKKGAWSAYKEFGTDNRNLLVTYEFDCDFFYFDFDFAPILNLDCVLCPLLGLLQFPEPRVRLFFKWNWFTITWLPSSCYFYNGWIVLVQAFSIGISTSSTYLFTRYLSIYLLLFWTVWIIIIPIDYICLIHGFMLLLSYFTKGT